MLLHAADGGSGHRHRNFSISEERGSLPHTTSSNALSLNEPLDVFIS